MKARTGSLEKTKHGLWRGRLPLHDGKRRRLSPFPEGTTEDEAKSLMAAIVADLFPATEPIVERRCCICKQTKPLEAFTKSKRAPRGHSYRCRVCCAQRVTRRRASDSDFREKLRTAERARRATPIAKKKMAIQRRKYDAGNPKKRRVYERVKEAVRLGSLVRGACEVCGFLRVHGHHDDYNKPLIVRWLCPAHHAKWHAENGEGANPKDDGATHG